MEKINDVAVQYGDAHGKVAIDFEDGASLQDFVPEGYFPIGFRISDPELKTLTVYAVDEKEAGGDASKVSTWSVGFTIAPGPVHAFRMKFSPKKFAALVKRLDMVVFTDAVHKKAKFKSVKTHDLTSGKTARRKR